MPHSLLLRSCLGPALLLLALPCSWSGAEDSTSTGKTKDGTVILRLDGSLNVRPKDNLLGASELSLFEATMQLRAVMRAPEKHVILDCSHGFHPTLAAAEELAAVLRSAKGKKQVSMLLDGGNNQAMVLAAACDQVVMPEAGMLEVDGLSLSSYYFADALAKLGIQFHAVISGDHKTAPEALTRSDPSPAAVAEYTDLLSELDGVLIGDTQHGSLSADALRAARALAPQTSAIAKSSKLVDATVEPDGWLADQPQPIRTYHDAKHATPDLSSLPGIMEFWSQMLSGSHADKQPKVVAVVELCGEIVDGEESEPGVNIAPGDTCHMFDTLRDDARVVAVVVRVDSPGGSAEASDRIHHAIKRCELKKPVVALFDSLAASGGYYIGCAAQQVLVHHGTITGSIGVFAVMPDASATLERLGVHRRVFTNSPRADLFGLGGWTPEKEAALKAVVTDTDARFQALVASTRHLDPAKVKELAGGRVYDGEQAVTLGLADGFGTLSVAVEKARALANEPEALPLERYPQRTGLLARLGLVDSYLGPVPTSLRLWSEVASSQTPVVMAWSNLHP